MITTHQYLDLYPINPNCEKLIVGTIHPHNHEEFKIPFFYGNIGSIWNILSDAFPEELPTSPTLNDVIYFLNNRNIGISDTIRKCERKNPTALDKDLIPKILNHEIIEQIRQSKVSTILFTSGFQKNNAFKLFYVDILKQKLSKEIKEKRELTLDKKHFGRPIRLVALYSPSGSANTGLSKSKIYLKQKKKYHNSQTPVKDFRIDYYRELFNS